MRRVLLAAALPAALTAAILPAAAQAESFVGFGSSGPNGDLFYSDTSATANDVLVRVVGNEISVRDRAGIQTTAPCRAITSVEVLCPATARSVQVGTFGGNDVVEYRARHSGSVNLGDGNDTVVGGRRESSGPSIEPVAYAGGAGNDQISYGGANQGVRLTPEDGLANDGRPGERENVAADFETIFGSNFADAPLFGTSGPNTMLGLGGNDQLGGGDGDDEFVSFIADGADDYHGAGGTDIMNYAGRTRPLLVDIDGVADDGEAGENDNVRANVERVAGGSAGDVLTGSNGADRLIGGLGDDRLDGLGGNDVFDMEKVADGADRINGGPGFDTVDYSKRTQPIDATLNFDGADDGEAGEGDELVGANEQILGGSADDTITAPEGSQAAHELHGGAGTDRLTGAEGPDTLVGGRGVNDTLVGLGDSDTIFAKDGESDIVGCGPGVDTAHLDASDIDGGCEDRPVGLLRLTASTVEADIDQPARMRLSWRHPNGWKQLRTIRLRLRDGLVPVGEVTIHPRAGRITGDDAVMVRRKHTQLTRKGKTVTARLALRLDESLAGQALKAEVEATDTRGARQLERDAARLRVAG